MRYFLYVLSVAVLLLALQAKAQGDRADLGRQLLAAVKQADIVTVKSLLDAGADIEVRDVRPNQGETPLHHAARTGNVEIAKLLVSRGAKLNGAAHGGFVPLHVAAGLNRRAMADYLLQAGADPNAQDEIGTPLHAATIQGHAQIVKLLLEKGADPNARNRIGEAPLHKISYIYIYSPSHTELISHLVRAGADLFIRDQNGVTTASRAVSRREEAALVLIENSERLRQDNADSREFADSLVLHNYMRALQILLSYGVKLDDSAAITAARWGTLEMATFVIGRGAGVHAMDNEGRTPLFIAVWGHHVALIDWLIDRGANINGQDKNGVTPIMVAVSSSGGHAKNNGENDGELIRMLVKRGASLTMRDKSGRAPLDVAAEFSYSLKGDQVRWLVALGAQVNAADENGVTALHRARHPAVAKALLEAGANPHAHDRAGHPPVFAMVKQVYADALVKLLVEHNINLKDRAHDGSTFLHHASAGQAFYLLDMVLTAQDGGVDVKMNDGRTPLHWAAAVGNGPAIHKLLSHGADVNAASKSGDTALHYIARSRSSWRGVDALVKAGGRVDTTNAAGETPIGIAQRNKNQSLIKALGH